MPLRGGGTRGPNTGSTGARTHGRLTGNHYFSNLRFAATIIGSEQKPPSGSRPITLPHTRATQRAATSEQRDTARHSAAHTRRQRTSTHTTFRQRSVLFYIHFTGGVRFTRLPAAVLSCFRALHFFSRTVIQITYREESYSFPIVI